MFNALQVSNKRAGSEFLMNCLNSHLQVKAFHELFQLEAKYPLQKHIREQELLPYRRYIRVYGKISKEEFLKKLDKYNTKIVLFKLMYNQFSTYKNFFISKIKDNNIKIIHLKRKNLIRQIISGKNAPWTDVFAIKSLTPEKLFELVEKANNNQKKWDSIIQKICGKNYIEVWYEDIVTTPTESVTWLESNANKKICDFLDIENTPMYSYTKKKNKAPMFDYLPDGDGTVKKFKNTQYEWMLDDK